MRAELLQRTEHGLYCPAGGFFIDPWQPVDRAVITHAHGDHARPGCGHYLTARAGLHVLRLRLGTEANIAAIEYGEPMHHNGVQLSLHPAGHILGSAQVRIEYQGHVLVVSGDYKLHVDPTCPGFKPVPCHVFVTESTFGLPIYRWPATSEVFAEIRTWWQANQAAGKTSVLFGYALGKAQHLLAGLSPDIGPIFTHGAVERVNEAYRASGIHLPETRTATSAANVKDWAKALIVAPVSARNTPWLRRFGNMSTAFASGWMQIRGARRRRTLDRGFVLSDHADWPGLLAAIDASGAEEILVTHGYTAELVRWLQEHGHASSAIPTPFKGEGDDGPEDLPE